MKKIYQGKKWKKYSQKRSLKQLKRSSRLKGKSTNRFASRGKQQTNYRDVKRRKRGYEISAPANFSLINNPEETLDFFGIVDNCISQGKNIFLDLRNVTELTTDAVIYMLSRIEHKRSLNKKTTISGNAPRDTKCNDILKTSGFYNYVYSSEPATISSDPAVYSIASDSMVSPEKAAEVKAFAKKSLGTEESPEAKVMYKILIECMSNTRNHAYSAKSSSSKWWLMAAFNKEANKVHFTFVDNGFGIPKTIRKNFREKITSVFGSLITKDIDLISSALKGDFRTKTGYKYRGKGLPEIYKSARRQAKENLIILSRKGYINCTTDMRRELKTVFYGTLLSWDFYKT